MIIVSSEGQTGWLLGDQGLVMPPVYVLPHVRRRNALFSLLRRVTGLTRLRSWLRHLSPRPNQSMEGWVVLLEDERMQQLLTFVPLDQLRQYGAGTPVARALIDCYLLSTGGFVNELIEARTWHLDAVRTQRETAQPDERIRQLLGHITDAAEILAGRLNARGSQDVRASDEHVTAAVTDLRRRLQRQGLVK
ncbi:hypothetical protein JNJ66_01095 [Candidatus Saccharibacteria bacterium]|nr:hypothetical protein [Candidatus Saccharibacteria bacterium]